MFLLSRPVVEFPFAAANLKTSFESRGRVVTNTNYLFSLLKGRTAVVSLAAEYTDSYKSATTKTLLHYRDFLIAQALLESLVNVQYKDFNKTILTTHSNRVWNTYTYDEIWPYKAPKVTSHSESYKYSDLLGSVAHYFKYVTPENYFPQNLLQEALKYVWARAGIDYSLSVRSRLDTLTALTNTNSVVLSKLAAPVPATETELLKSFRRNGLRNDFIDELPLRILLGEYSDLAFDFRSSLFTERDRQTLVSILRAINGLIRPGGVVLLLQALAVEGLTKAAAVLQALPQTVLQTDIDSFRLLENYKDTQYRIAESLALTYDAYLLLDLFRTFEGVGTKADAAKQLTTYWLSGSSLNTISSDSPNRIDISRTRPALVINADDLSSTSDPVFLALQEQGPKGDPQETVVLKVLDQTPSTTTVSIQNIFGQPVAGTLSVIYQTGVQVYTKQQLSPSVYVLETEGTGSAAVVATPLDVEAPSLESFLAADPEVIASNPLTISSQPSFTDIAVSVDDQIGDVVSTYQVALGIQNTSTPSGSNKDLYKAAGLDSPRDTDYRTIVESARKSIYGARTENTSRMVGLFDNQTEHIEGSIDSALEWAEALEAL
jgi:hypothetical protein